MTDDFVVLLGVLFLDNFYVSTAIVIALVLILVIDRWSALPMPRNVTNAVGWLLIAGGIGVAAILVLHFFSYPKGIDRLALLAVMLSAAPLFIAAILTIFLFKVGWK